MKRTISVALAPTLAMAMMAGTAAPGFADQPAADIRYQIERIDGGFVRLDRRMGSISHCRQTDDQFVCRMAADDRAAYEADIDALAARVAALEARLAAPGTPSAKTPSGPEVPSTEEFERSLGMMETFIRRFWGVVQDLEKTQPGAPDGKPAPDRT